MNLLRGFIIFLSYLFFGAFLASIVILMGLIAGSLIPAIYPISIGFLGTIILIWFTLQRTMYEIDGNKMLLTIKMFSSNEVNGHTMYNIYNSGFNFVWWWEKEQETIDLEDSIINSFLHKVSAKDADIPLNIQYKVLPDPNNIFAYMLNGKNAKERREKIALAVETILKRNVETFLSRLNMDTKTIIQNTDDVIDGENGLQSYISEVLEMESNRLGIIIMELRIGDVSYSEKASEARDDRLTIKLQSEAIDEARKKFPKLSDKEIIDYIQVQTGKTKKSIVDFQTRKGLKSVVPVGVGNV